MEMNNHNGDLLLVIDMQNAYTSNGPWACPKMEEAAGNIIRLIESGKFSRIIFTRFDAPAAPVGTWKDYNEINREVNEDEQMNKILPRLQPYADKYPLYSKSTYSSLTVPQIQEEVNRCIEDGSSVVLTGVVSECCVLATALQAVDMGCPVIYITDGCAGVSEQTEQAVIDVLRGLDYVQTTISDTASYLSE
ncbi:MAG: cysteine hydrolase [Erysipelotrichaceae bacterium]|nr:cysteine hydrolase [Erysipelotrichaceae bacterium]